MLELAVRSLVLGDPTLNGCKKRTAHGRTLPGEPPTGHARNSPLGRYHECVQEFFLAREPSSSAEVRGLVIHDIKEVEGVRQQEEQEDKGNEVNGEVEEVRRDAQHTHET